MLIEVEIANPVKSCYTAKVYVSPERRREQIDIPFPDRRERDEFHYEKRDMSALRIRLGREGEET